MLLQSQWEIVPAARKEPHSEVPLKWAVSVCGLFLVFAARCRGVGGFLWRGGSLCPPLRPSRSPPALLSSQGAETRGAACLSPFLRERGWMQDAHSLGWCLHLTCLELTSVSLLVFYLLKAISQTVPKQGGSQNNFSPTETRGQAMSCH